MSGRVLISLSILLCISSVTADFDRLKCSNLSHWNGTNELSLPNFVFVIDQVMTSEKIHLTKHLFHIVACLISTSATSNRSATVVRLGRKRALVLKSVPVEEVGLKMQKIGSKLKGNLPRRRLSNQLNITINALSGYSWPNSLRVLFISDGDFVSGYELDDFVDLWKSSFSTLNDQKFAIILVDEKFTNATVYSTFSKIMDADRSSNEDMDYGMVVRIPGWQLLHYRNKNYLVQLLTDFLNKSLYADIRRNDSYIHHHLLTSSITAESEAANSLLPSLFQLVIMVIVGTLVVLTGLVFCMCFMKDEERSSNLEPELKPTVPLLNSQLQSAKLVRTAHADRNETATFNSMPDVTLLPAKRHVPSLPIQPDPTSSIVHVEDQRLDRDENTVEIDGDDEISQLTDRLAAVHFSTPEMTIKLKEFERPSTTRRPLDELIGQWEKRIRSSSSIAERTKLDINNQVQTESLV